MKKAINQMQVSQTQPSISNVIGSTLSLSYLRTLGKKKQNAVIDARVEFTLQEGKVINGESDDSLKWVLFAPDQ